MNIIIPTRDLFCPRLKNKMANLNHSSKNIQLEQIFLILLNIDNEILSKQLCETFC